MSIGDKIDVKLQKPLHSALYWKGKGRKIGAAWSIVTILSLASLSLWALGGATESICRPKMYWRGPLSQVQYVLLISQSDQWAFNLQTWQDLDFVYIYIPCLVPVFISCFFFIVLPVFYNYCYCNSACFLYCPSIYDCCLPLVVTWWFDNNFPLFYSIILYSSNKSIRTYLYKYKYK